MNIFEITDRNTLSIERHVLEGVSAFANKRAEDWEPPMATAITELLVDDTYIWATDRFTLVAYEHDGFSIGVPKDFSIRIPMPVYKTAIKVTQAKGRIFLDVTDPDDCCLWLPDANYMRLDIPHPDNEFPDVYKLMQNAQKQTTAPVVFGVNSDYLARAVKAVRKITGNSTVKVKVTGAETTILITGERTTAIVMPVKLA